MVAIPFGIISSPATRQIVPQGDLYSPPNKLSTALTGCRSARPLSTVQLTAPARRSPILRPLIVAGGPPCQPQIAQDPKRTVLAGVSESTRPRSLGDEQCQGCQCSRLELPCLRSSALCPCSRASPPLLSIPKQNHFLLGS